MTESPRDGATDQLATALTVALAARTRDAFTALLTDDVRWGGELRGAGHECTDRTQVGDHYAGLLDSGLTLRVSNIEPIDTALDNVLTVRVEVSRLDHDDAPPEMTVRVTLRDGLIADICILDGPPVIEVLYVKGCPHHEQLLPHLRNLLERDHITATVALNEITTDEQARTNRFLGSPTVRVNGSDVAATPLSQPGSVDTADRFGVQCRLYQTSTGTRGVPDDQWILDALIDNPMHEAAIAAIRVGDVTTLRRLLAATPELAALRLPRHEGRTLMHVATDWPGHFPNVAETITVLASAGADPNSPSLGEYSETPLHWAASSNDVEAIDALLNVGADIEAKGAVIAGGTPLADATAFGQWDAARRLVAHGASVNLFEAAALGLESEVERLLESELTTHESVTSSFWGACHGGHVSTATVLLDHGADINWIGYDGLTPFAAAERSECHEVTRWLEQRVADSTPTNLHSGATHEESDRE